MKARPSDTQKIRHRMGRADTGLVLLLYRARDGSQAEAVHVGGQRHDSMTVLMKNWDGGN